MKFSLKQVSNKKNIRSVLNAGFYLFVFLLPLQTRYFVQKKYLGGEYWEYASISIYLSDILLIGLLFLAFFLFLSDKKNALQIKKAWFYLAGVELFVFISIFFAPDKVLAVYAYLRFLLGLGVFYFLTSSFLKRRHVFIAFLSSAFFQSLLAIWQAVRNYSPANKFFGMAGHNPDDLGVFVVELADKTRILRSYGSFDHPNMLGMFLFIAFFVCFEYFFLPALKRNSKNIFVVFYSFLSSLFLFALLLSFSRSSFLLLGFYFLFLLLRMFLSKTGLKRALIVLFSFALPVLIFSYFYQEPLLSRLGGGDRLETRSNNERLEQYAQSKRIIAENIFFGVGAGNYSAYLAEKDKDEMPAWQYQPVHNVFLLLWAEIGIFGFLAFLLFLLFLVRRLLSASNFLSLFLLFMLITSLLFDHWLWSLHFGIFFLFFVLGLLHSE